MLLLLIAALLNPGAAQDSAQDVPKPLKDQIDTIVAGAYAAASQGFPCKIKGRGKPKILRWEQVDRCLNEAADRPDWEALSDKLTALRIASRGVSVAELKAAVDASLDAHALPFEKVFAVSGEKVLLPLTNSLLKYLPPDSLANLPVTDKRGKSVGTFAGVYSFERMGGLASANTYKLSLFQYTDRNGNLQSATDKLLLDSFGVPWSEAKSQRGFRLVSDKLALH
jgi:hypothetical protein